MAKCAYQEQKLLLLLMKIALIKLQQPYSLNLHQIKSQHNINAMQLKCNTIYDLYIPTPFMCRGLYTQLKIYYKNEIYCNIEILSLKNNFKQLNEKTMYFPKSKYMIKNLLFCWPYNKN
jgi:hypothetical protein